MKKLWTFESREKLDKFLKVLEEHGLVHETSSGGSDNSEALTLSVEERDYSRAKKILLKHRERRTSADLL